jgi:hypothetical protein
MFIEIRAMHSHVTFSTPTSPLRHPGGMIAPPHVREILFAMTTEAQTPIPRNQHLVVNRSMNFMARCATFTKRQMFERKGTSLLFVAFETFFIGIFHRSSRPGSCVGSVGIMTIRAGHMAFQHRMMMRKTEFGFLFHVAGKAHFRILFGIDDLIALASAVFRMQAPGAVTHLAAFHLDTFHRDSDPFVGGELEVLDLFFMTHGAGLRADVFSAGHLMIFEDLLEDFYIIIATGGKKEGTS